MRHEGTHTHVKAETERCFYKPRNDKAPSSSGRGLEGTVPTPGFQPSGLQNSKELISVVEARALEVFCEGKHPANTRDLLEPAKPRCPGR